MAFHIVPDLFAFFWGEVFLSSLSSRIVITGVGLTSPIGNGLKQFRSQLLQGASGITHQEIRHMGQVAVGRCSFDETLYQDRKRRRRGTRAGSIAIYCANECLKDAKLDLNSIRKDRVGVYLGITEHGNVETEEEVHLLHQNQLDVSLWSHHHNPRTVANAPAGEVTLNLGITGPHYTIGAACAAGNLGPIHGLQMLRLGEIDYALAGGISESAQTFGIFAAFAAQGALGHHQNPASATRPLDKNRNGIVVSEGGCIFLLERLDQALSRNATIYGEILGYHMNSDASDYVLPYSVRQKECIQQALSKAKCSVRDVDIINLHATGTVSGDEVECEAVRSLLKESEQEGKVGEGPWINGTKGHIGHCMGAAGALELAGNLGSFDDGLVHPFRAIDCLDEKCTLPGLVHGEALKATRPINIIVNNSFGMLGINSTLVVGSYHSDTLSA